MISAQATHRFPSARRPLVTAVAALLIATACIAPALAEDVYTQEKVYNLRPKADGRKDFGHLGPTGIVAYIHPGVKVQVEQIADGSPAAGKIEKDDVILGVNGKSLKGLNPFVAVGEAITAAEASNGKLVFDIQRRRNETTGDGHHSGDGHLQRHLAGRLCEVEEDRRAGRGLLPRGTKGTERSRDSRRADVPVPAVNRRRRPPARGQGVSRAVHGQGQDRRRRQHLEQRLQRHRLCRVLPAHR
jgi:hypothetical protein